MDDCLAGKDWDQAKVDGLLGDNAEALALWRQALERPAFQVPPSRTSRAAWITSTPGGHSATWPT